MKVRLFFERSGGNLSKRSQNNGPVEIVADTRGDWIGRVEHNMVHGNEISIINTGRVIKDVNVDQNFLNLDGKAATKE